MRAFLAVCTLFLLVASAANAGTELGKAEKQLQKRAVLAESPPASRKSLCMCTGDLLAGRVGRLEYVTETVGVTLVRFQCHILAFDAGSGAAVGGGSICSPFSIVP